MDRGQKQAEIKFLEDRTSKSQLLLCADYRGLTVEEFTSLRGRLRELGVYAKVVKNRLAKISFKNVFKDADSAELEKFLDLFQGPSFVMFADDEPVSPSKTATGFAKEMKPFEIKGGWFEGKFLDVGSVTALSSMPSKEETLSMLLNLMTVPATQLVRVLSAPARQLAQVVEAYRAKLEES